MIAFRHLRNGRDPYVDVIWDIELNTELVHGRTKLLPLSGMTHGPRKYPGQASNCTRRLRAFDYPRGRHEHPLASGVPQIPIPYRTRHFSQPAF